MSVINYRADRRILVSVKGHPYPRDAFFDIFESFDDIAYTAVEQPASQVFFTPALASAFDAFVLYDMPGIDFSTQPPTFVEPPEQFRNGFLELLEQGQGFVFLHHAIAAWPLWPEYAEIVGGRFLYRPGELRGVPRLDSGYRHGVEYRASVVNSHPVTESLPQCFPVTDELYLHEVFEEDVIPLLQSDYSFTREHFNSALKAVGGEAQANTPWQHPPGSNVVGWVKSYRNSPVVYLQMGDGVDVYANPHFRQLLYNAVQWVASDEALEWARVRNQCREPRQQP